MKHTKRSHEVTEEMDLLDETGELREPGWARRQVFKYNRKHIKASSLLIKEWDYYMVVSKDCALALTISDAGYAGMAGIDFFTFQETPKVHSSVSARPLSLGKLNLPSNSHGGDIVYKRPGVTMKFLLSKGKRRLLVDYASFQNGKRMIADITLYEPDMDSMVIATPWQAEHAFYYNQKINCMRAQGWVTIGKQTYFFNPETDFATLDWGRGVWTHDNTWYWSSGNCDMNGHSFGFNLGYGFADTSAASENILFYDGKASKIDDISIHIPKNLAKDTWTITSSDGRFEAIFEPIVVRRNVVEAGFAGTNQHQVFGHMTGKAVLDDGTVIPMQNLLCFIEKVRMKY